MCMEFDCTKYLENNNKKSQFIEISFEGGNKRQTLVMYRIWIHGPKQHKENHLLSLEHRCWLSLLIPHTQRSGAWGSQDAGALVAVV